MATGTYHHWILARTAEALNRVAAELAAAGYMVPDAPRPGCTIKDCAGCDHHWHLSAYGAPMTSAEFIAGGPPDLLAICRAHSAHIGGGAYIGTLTPPIGSEDEPEE